MRQDRLFVAFLLCLILPAMAVAQTPTVTAVLNGGSLDNRLSPGVLATVFGSNLGPARSFQGTAPGLSITVAGRAAFVAFSSATQLSVQIPVELSPGAATLVVEYQGRASAPFNIQLASHSPGVFTVSAGTGIVLFTRQGGTVGSAQNPANPGELIVIFATGLGPTDPVVPTGTPSPGSPVATTVTAPRVTIAGRPARVVSSGLLPAAVGLYQVVVVVPGELGPGTYPLVLEIGGFSSNAASLPVAITGLVLTQSGFTFQAVQGGGAPSPKNFRILNGTASALNFTITTSTLAGGSAWLSVSPNTGSTSPTAPATIEVRVSASGLPPGDYYGQIRVEAPGAPNSPQVLTVVLNVSGATVNPGPTMEPTGLVFVGLLGGAAPGAQSVRLTNLTNRSTSFTATASFAGGRSWFTHTPASGSVPPNQPVTVQVQPTVAGLPAGVYRGAISLSFPLDNTTRVVDLLLVLTPRLGAPAAVSMALPPGTDQGTTCTPTRLLPVFTLLGASFNAPAAWPAPIEVLVVDDCGTAMRTGSVTTTFSNGDPELLLTPQQDGRWSGTWAPRNARGASTTVTATARQSDRGLEGVAEVGGSVQANQEIPAVNSGGLVSAASFAAGAIPAPGEMVSIFGVKLADGLEVASELPLKTQMQGALLTLGGQPLPLVFTSENQINAILPYDLRVGATHQLVARRGNRLSVPEPVSIASAEPAIFTVDRTGRGQGHIYVFPSATEQVLADAARPAKAGDVIVIYCAGLGPVSPPVAAGVAAPADTLRRTAGTVTLTIGGRPATVAFAGLTPGFTGLYQVNSTIPAGVTPGSQVPVVLSVAGIPSPPVTLAVQ